MPEGEKKSPTCTTHSLIPKEWDYVAIDGSYKPIETALVLLSRKGDFVTFRPSRTALHLSTCNELTGEVMKTRVEWKKSGYTVRFEKLGFGKPPVVILPIKLLRRLFKQWVKNGRLLLFIRANELSFQNSRRDPPYIVRFDGRLSITKEI